ncbi:ATP-binding protein [Telluria aromaticivorans]|uniref:ATPase n=1 Tax=Telluria aromaticivorans TaxID=2725995 RepID=A0A7Y2JW51_9BURK|nr:AAA family ATPase [Telluria aromaticivorans]NNG21995.1 hypothetical protein [Telluria aromaticivorans]
MATATGAGKANPLPAARDEAGGLAIGPFVLEPESAGASYSGTRLPLTRSEFLLFQVLVEHGGTVAGERLLLARCRDAAGPRGLFDQVAALNCALARHAPELFAIQVGKGYMLVLPPEPRSEVGPRQLIGREAALATVDGMLAGHRFVSIVGPGGIGKTSVARALLPGLDQRYPDGILTLDLAAMFDPGQLLPAMAQALGVRSVVGGPDADLAGRFASLLAGRSLLVLLDSCEHMIEAAGQMAEMLLAAAPGVSVLVTSREPLRADGERVYRLEPMGLPSPRTVDVGSALSAPAVRLFVAHAFGARGLEQEDVAAVTALCRDLDGLPLALELAAAMAPGIGLVELASQAGRRLLDGGAAPMGARGRHLSLGAMLAWSYDILSDDEKTVFRRLSVFRGGFTLEAAAAIAADARLDGCSVKEIVIGLMTKSLVSAAREADGRHRLLDTTRAYAARLHEEDADRLLVLSRHADFLCGLLEEAQVAWLHMPRRPWLAQYAPWLDDVRAALDWAYSGQESGIVGARLTVLSFPLADQAGAVLEFSRHVRQGLAVLARVDNPPPLLRMSLACHARDNIDEPFGDEIVTMSQLDEGIREAELAGNPQSIVAPLMGYWCFCFSTAKFSRALETAYRLDAAARRMDDPTLVLIGKKTSAQSLHYMGRHEEAMAAAAEAMALSWRKIPLNYSSAPLEIGTAMRLLMSRLLWMRGDFGRASDLCAQACLEAQDDRPTALCHAYALAAIPIALWNRDFASCDALLATLEDHVRRYSIGLWQTWARNYREVLELVATADASAGPERFAEVAARVAASSSMQSDHMASFDPRMLTAKAEERAHEGAVGWCVPETLRAQAEALLSCGNKDALQSAAVLLARARSLAHEQGALLWELRSACSQVRLAQRLGRTGASVAELGGVLARFPEGPDVADLRLARALLRS